MKPPCLAIEDSISTGIKGCCQLFEKTNIETIMSLMKYSLDLSNPWLTKYSAKENVERNNQALDENRDIFKVWLANGGNEMSNIFSTNGTHDFLHEYGWVAEIKYKFLNGLSYTFPMFHALLFLKTLMIITPVYH